MHTVNLLEIDAVLEGEGAVDSAFITRKLAHKGSGETSTLYVDAVRHKGAC
jgi:hypothetical protein